MKFLTYLAALLTGVLSPAFALAQVSFGAGNGNWFVSFGSGGGGVGACSSTICGVALNILYIINSVLVPLLFAIAFIVFLYGVASAYIFSRGDAERIKKGHQLILWGIIGFVIMISLWGIVNVVASTFGLYGYSAPPTPQSYPVY